MQLGSIRVGPDGIWLVTAGLMFWWGIKGDNVVAEIVRFAGLTLAVLGIVSVLIWAVVSVWRKIWREATSRSPKAMPSPQSPDTPEK
jgi:hypothetical protein